MNTDSVFYGAINKKYKKCIYSKHAEVNCILQCEYKYKKLISKSIMYLIKLDKNNKAIKCDSCSNCKKYLNKNNMKKVKSIKLVK